MATTVSRPLQYEIDDPERVAAYLDEHPLVQETLAIAREILPRYFDNPAVSVYVIEDPEDDVPPTLRVAVLVSRDLAGARERLYRFRREWWRSQPAELIPLLEFGID